ncbi:regulator of sigma E protease [Chitinophaga skermanii]|uniref:Zinc metalloprotease n=1 Tax=Chitinophaga skermanii TaxID=331697 RepID=A0A327QMC3_9BACT|nr:RIP metalloprotease RseP [Chitinophaga skermanii]RAJ05015.1 regulator of sigma E protease [Chitinophaga skermanii]
MTIQVILIKAAQLILSLSILVVLHELGHFIPARLFKIKVEKFYLFFDPGFSLFKFKKGETEYGIGWLPLGGYVKIAGMIDESMDKEQMMQPPQPWEFRAKPAWQRLIVMIGGVTVNLILGFLIYAMILWHYGESYLPTKNAVYGIVTDSLGRTAGLQNGDKIISVDNSPVEAFHKIPAQVILNEAKSIQVDRAGQQLNLVLPAGFRGALASSKQGGGTFQLRMPFIIGEFTENSAGKKAGLKVDDRIIAINGQPAQYNDEVITAMQGLKNQAATITVVRNERDTMQIKANVPADGILGMRIGEEQMQRVFHQVTVKYSFIEAIPAGFSKAISTLVTYVQQIGLLFKKSSELKASESLGGFGSIAKLFPDAWDWHSFWNLTALLSIILAFMNILPIPALDGGHVLFLLYEMVTGRKPSIKFMEYAQIVGMVLLFGLLLFANGLDVWRAIFK